MVIICKIKLTKTKSKKLSVFEPKLMKKIVPEKNIWVKNETKFFHKKNCSVSKTHFLLIKINSNQKNSLSFNLPEIHLTWKLFGRRWLDGKSLFVFLYLWKNLVSFSLLTFHFKFFLKRKLIKKGEEKTCWKFANLDSPAPPPPVFPSSKQFSFFSATKKYVHVCTYVR